MSRPAHSSTGQSAPHQRIPLSTVARQHLVRDIQAGVYPAGSQLPAEDELARLLGVSRITLRDAISTLENDGYVQRRRGIGTFVLRTATLENTLELNSGVTELIHQAGAVPGTSATAITTVPATQVHATHLDTSVGTPLTRIERVRTADGAPVIVSHDYLAPHTVINPAKLSHGHALYAVLVESGYPIHHGIAELHACAATETLSTQLQVDPGAPLLEMRQVDYDANDKPVLYAVEWYVSEAFRITVRRRGPTE